MCGVNNDELSCSRSVCLSQFFVYFVVVRLLQWCTMFVICHFHWVNEDSIDVTLREAGSYTCRVLLPTLLIFITFPSLSPLPPIPRLFGCCCSLLAHAGLSYCSVLAAVREKLKDWERVECWTVAELGKEGWRKNTDDNSGSLALTVTACMSLCLCFSGQMDPKSSNWEEEERRG